MISTVIKPFAMAGLWAVLSSATSPTAGKPCTRDDAILAEDSVSLLRTWPEIYKSFRRFGHCDDGAIAEGFSDAVVRILARRWKALSELRPLVSTHRDFHDFVLQHIDFTTDARDLDQVIANAATRCPGNARPLCGEIERQAREARRETEVPE